MATLVLSAVGTAIGGPIGGAIGALVGQQVDRAIIGSPKVEGRRLNELEVSTSSYGSPIPRQFGKMRRAGTIIWATDLKEAKETSGGGKGKPKVTSYTYSASFAVALSSRPLMSLGKIWADGNLLRGAAGDLKVGGTLRFHDGYADQPVDPLIAADKGASSPAFRGLSYVVFEDLQLEEFGNRIPALTFELLAETGEVTLQSLLGPIEANADIAVSLNGLAGFSDDGGTLAGAIGALQNIYPISVAASANTLHFAPAESALPADATLPEPSAHSGEDAFAAQSGAVFSRNVAQTDIPTALRYYDVGRDYLAGLQRADGRAPAGRIKTIELAGALSAATARNQINMAAENALWAQSRIAWRMAELDPELGPGKIVRVPDLPGNWLIERWEWRDGGVELELRRLPRGPARTPPADAGQVLSAPDLQVGQSAIEVFELPWDGTGDPNTRRAYAAVSSAEPGWKGAALFLDRNDALVPLGPSGSERAVIGSTVSILPPSSSLLLNCVAQLEVDLIGTDLGLTSTDMAGLANGDNLALVGTEVIQFAQAEQIGATQWQLTGILRGRGGTEAVAAFGQPAGASFVLLDGSSVSLDSAVIGTNSGIRVGAVGIGDAEPVYDSAENSGTSLRPLSPVHPIANETASGALLLCWTRRARGAWDWPDGVDAPMVEDSELYRVGIGAVDQPDVAWEVSNSELLLSPAQFADVQSQHSGQQIWVRQVGTHSASDALLLTTVP